MGLIQPLFLYFRLFYIIQLTDKFLPMLGFELRISGVRSNRSANCATTTAQCDSLRNLVPKQLDLVPDLRFSCKDFSVFS